MDDRRSAGRRGTTCIWRWRWRWRGSGHGRRRRRCCWHWSRRCRKLGERGVDVRSGLTRCRDDVLARVERRHRETHGRRTRRVSSRRRDWRATIEGHFDRFAGLEAHDAQCELRAGGTLRDRQRHTGVALVDRKICRRALGAVDLVGGNDVLAGLPGGHREGQAEGSSRVGRGRVDDLPVVAHLHDGTGCEARAVGGDVCAGHAVGWCDGERRRGLRCRLSSRALATQLAQLAQASGWQPGQGRLQATLASRPVRGRPRQPLRNPSGFAAAVRDSGVEYSQNYLVRNVARTPRRAAQPVCTCSCRDQAFVSCNIRARNGPVCRHLGLPSDYEVRLKLHSVRRFGGAIRFVSRHVRRCTRFGVRHVAVQGTPYGSLFVTCVGAGDAIRFVVRHVRRCRGRHTVRCSSRAPVQGAAAPRGQSQLRSYLAARSFPPRPPATSWTALVGDVSPVTLASNYVCNPDQS